MPRHDTDHDAVKAALIKDGWTITHDPLLLEYGGRNLYVDLAAEEPITAERAGRKIAVEVKSFQAPSDITEWERALGQFVFCRFLMTDQEPERMLFLALRHEAYDRLFQDARGVDFLRQNAINLIVYDAIEEEIVRWIP